MATLHPCGNRVLVTLMPDPPRSDLLVVITSPSRAQRAKVVAIGPEVRDVKPGELVLVSRLAGQEVGDKVLMPEGSVLAHLNGDGL